MASPAITICPFVLLAVRPNVNPVMVGSGGIRTPTRHELNSSYRGLGRF
jgi:hypothetical protein